MAHVKKELIKALQKTLGGLAFSDVEEFRSLPEWSDFHELFKHMSDDALKEIIDGLETKELKNGALEIVEE